MNEEICIPISRFEELLDKETRLDVLTDKLINDNYISTEEVLRIIGSNIAIKKADEIREEDKKRREEYLSEQYSEEDA